MSSKNKLLCFPFSNDNNARIPKVDSSSINADVTSFPQFI